MENKEPKIKILVACHKADPAIRQDDIYMPIQVGKALHPDLDLGFQGDDTGDNISEKNGSYCELTAMYWAWKNLPKDVDIVGLCHYRRYFKLDKKDPQGHIQRLLGRHDAIILPYNDRAVSNVQFLKELTCQEDVALFLDLLIDLCPNWKGYIGEYFYKQNSSSCYNMFIMRRDVFDDYCTFLFQILKDLDDVLPISPYIRIQRRLGYFAEVLLGFWLKVNKKKIKFSIFDHHSKIDFRHAFRSIRHNIAFRLFRHRSFMVYYAAYVGLKQNNLELKHLVPDEAE